MFKNHNILGLCLTLALTVAGFSDAHAVIVIDTFEDGDQWVCSVCPGLPVSLEVQTSSGIGGWRSMEATGVPARVEGLIIPEEGTLFSSLRPDIPSTDGRLTTVWNGEGDVGLGGIDLTAGGDFFRVQVIAVDTTNFNQLILRVTDTTGMESSVSRQWQDLDVAVGVGSGLNFFPFSSLGGDANLTSVDAIALELTHSNPGESITISDIRVVDAADIGPVDLSGAVEDAGGTPLCALVLASGQFMFSCNPNGPYSLLDLPRATDGTVKRQVYVDGFFPNVETLVASTDETVVMTRANNCPDYNSFPEPGVFPGSDGKRIDVSGTVLLQDTQTPVCAMVLGNGQFGFTCDGTGTYSANIPLDANGQYKLQVYADGFAPMVQRFDEFTTTVEVRLARATECQ